MATSSRSDVDFIEELRLRRWARENYVPGTARKHNWHPIILEEMSRKDEEGTVDDLSPAFASAVA